MIGWPIRPTTDATTGRRWVLRQKSSTRRAFFFLPRHSSLQSYPPTLHYPRTTIERIIRPKTTKIYLQHRKIRQGFFAQVSRSSLNQSPIKLHQHVFGKSLEIWGGIIFVVEKRQPQHYRIYYVHLERIV